MNVNKAEGSALSCPPGSTRPGDEASHAGGQQRGGDLNSSRGGVIAVVALACVAAASVVMAVAVRRSLAEWKVVRFDAQRTQCRWLAESALERAVARLAADPKYEGELWRIPAAVLTGKDDSHGAAVKIEVAATAKEASLRVIRVQADWPEDSTARTRVRKQTTIRLR